MINESLVKYLAGLLDADGSLSFEHHKDGGRVRISLRLHLMSSEDIDRHGFVASLPALTGHGNTNQYTLAATGRQYTQWFVGDRAGLEMLLPRLIKHMVIKARHWQWLLEFWRDWRSQEKGQRSMTVEEWEALSLRSRESRRTNVGPIKPKNHPTWAWLAGFLDGDGCFSFRTSRNRNMRLSVSVHEIDVSALELLQKAFGGTIRPNSHKPHVKVWWRGLGPTHRSFALAFLPKLVRQARLKRHRIEEMIHWLREHGAPQNGHRQRLSVPEATA